MVSAASIVAQAALGALTPAGPAVVATVSIKKLVISQTVVNGIGFVTRKTVGWVRLNNPVLAHPIEAPLTVDIGTQTSPTSIFTSLPGPDLVWGLASSVAVHFLFSKYVAPRLFKPCETLITDLQNDQLSDKSVADLSDAVKETFKESGTTLIEVPTALLTSTSSILTVGTYIVAGLGGVFVVTIGVCSTIKWFNKDKHIDGSKDPSIQINNEVKGPDCSNRYEVRQREVMEEVIHGR